MAPQAIRRARNGRVRGAWLAALFMYAATCMYAAICLVSPARAATTEMIVSDPLTGIAIFGFDPVAFFVDREARKGLPSLELKYAGVVWRFSNEGDRSAFKANPKTYMPRFGGYDPIAVARRAPAPGLPSLFVVREQRLFLFSNQENRKAFLAKPDEAIAAAEFSWPQLVRKLVP